jgi:hypothetical protein
MLILNDKYYLSWIGIKDPLVQYWVRRWQDALHTRTHPEWAFCPLTVTCLARLWDVFSAPQAKSQRRAIRVLAARRSGYMDAIRFPCPDNDNDACWQKYWDDVHSHSDEFRNSLFGSVRSLLCHGGDGACEELSRVTEVLAAELMQWEYTDYELFVRAGGVIDPAGKHLQTPLERVLGLLDHLQRRPMYEFVVWTEIISQAGNLSKSMSRRLAGPELETPESWRSGTGLSRLPNCVAAITKREATHSLTAFIAHRMEAAQLLRVRCGQQGLKGFRLATESSVLRPSREDRKIWVHSQPTFADVLEQPDPAIEPNTFGQAVEAVEDDPEETIRLLSDCFERKFGTDWPQIVGEAYRLRLRGTLSGRLAAAIRETQNREGMPTSSERWWHRVPQDGFIDAASAANRIMDDKEHADVLLSSRLMQVSHAGSVYRTPGWINAWLYLAKGIRNRVVHAGEWPPALFPTAIFISRLMLHAFVSAFPNARRPDGTVFPSSAEAKST